MMQITDSTNRVTRIRSSTDARVKSTLARSFSRLSRWKASSSLASFTKALITAMPEKLSWEKSDSWEKASCRMSHFFIMYLPTTALDASSRAMGIMDSPVITGSMPHILITDRPPSSSASKNMRKPEP